MGSNTECLDRGCLAQIIARVSSAARVLSRGRDDVRVTMHEDSGELCVTVSKVGRVPLGVIAAMFERCDSDLRLARELAQDHGGRLVAISTAGELAFAVCLPKR